MANRIRRLRERLGLSLEGLASIVGTDRSTIWRYETGRTPLLNDGARKIAEALRLNRAEELFSGVSPSMTQLSGVVVAGEIVNPRDDHAVEVDAPPGFEDGIALLVKGPSMAPAYRDGDLLFANRPTPVGSEVVGKDCVVMTKDGTLLLKRIYQGTRPGTYRLFGHDTQDLSEDTVLEAASVVSWVRRT